MSQMEGQVLLWIQEYLRSEPMTAFFRFITTLGNTAVIWIVLTVVCLCIKRYRVAGICSGASLILSALVNNVFLKNVIARTRPYEVIEGLVRLIPAQVDYSFPSGHTGSSFASAVILYFFLPRKYGIIALILAVLISLSRLYLGVHYPSDVLGGAVIGTIIAYGVKLAERSIFGRIKSKQDIG